MVVAESIKRRILGLLELMPCGRDFSLVLRRNRLGISYRGVFEKYEEAVESANTRKHQRYDILNMKKATNYDQERESLGAVFRDYDYPLIFWLSRILKTSDRVLELGGSVGHLYHSIPQFFEYPEGLQWEIAELPEAVKLGRRLAADMGEERLRFVDSSAIGECEPCSLFVTAGTVQYMRASLPEILESLATLPDHVLLNSLPVHPTREFWTLQDLGLCEVPYRVFSRSHLLTSMNELGYQEVRHWLQPRQIKIPFFLNLRNEGYLGAYYNRTGPL